MEGRSWCPPFEHREGADSSWIGLDDPWGSGPHGRTWCHVHGLGDLSRCHHFPDHGHIDVSLLGLSCRCVQAFCAQVISLRSLCFWFYFVSLFQFLTKFICTGKLSRWLSSTGNPLDWCCSVFSQVEVSKWTIKERIKKRLGKSKG